MHHDSLSDVVWIRKSDPLPDTCCHCGSFTDRRVTVKHVEMVAQSGKSGPGATAVTLAVVLQIALGPIGWLFSAMMDDEETEASSKIVKQKSRIRISQCPLCHGMQPPEVVDTRDGSYAFRVHRKFKQGLEELKN